MGGGSAIEKERGTERGRVTSPFDRVAVNVTDTGFTPFPVAAGVYERAPAALMIGSDWKRDADPLTRVSVKETTLEGAHEAQPAAVFTCEPPNIEEGIALETLQVSRASLSLTIRSKGV